MTPQRNPTVAVVGGGLAGLVAARHLVAAGVDATLYERRDEVGGRVRTLERDGYRFDRGFQVLFTDYPAVRAELDLEALALRPFAPGAVIARDGHRSTLSDPLRDPRALPATLLNRDVTLGDKLRVLRLRRRLAGTDPETIFTGEDTTIREYLHAQGFSQRFITHFAAPFYGGITLDRSLSTSKRVFEYTFRTLSSGSIAVPAAGMGAIPAQIADRARTAGARIETGVTVTAVDAKDDGDGDGDGDIDDESVTYTLEGATDATADAVVVATDPPTARELTSLESIPTAGKGCLTQFYAMPKRTDLESGGRLILNADDDAGPNHVVPHSEVAPEYAPDDASLISATYLAWPNDGDGTPDDTDEITDDETLFERTRATLAAWYPERRFGDLEPVHTERVPFAQFAQPPGIHDRLPSVCDPDGAVYLAGDYTQWSSIQGALESGRVAASAVIRDLE
ncbi:NAD(P)/FAD-dependent oxidoreductase [Natrialbaceae archaeon A-CW1-1]